MGKDVLEIEPAATLTDTAGPKARAGAVGDGCVEGGAEDGDVVGGFRVLEAAGVGEVGEG